MGQILRADKIKTMTKVTATQLSLPANSYFTIGGQQFTNSTDLSVTLSGLSANTLYFVYAVRSSGVTSLVVSANVNSQGPAGYSAWKLVGAFYTDNSSQYGSFVNIEGVPESDVVPFTATITSETGAPTNYTAIGKFRRYGIMGHFEVEILFSTTSAAFSNIYSSVPFTMDTSKLATSSLVGNFPIGHTSVHDSGTSSYPMGGKVDIETTTKVCLSWWNVTNTSQSAITQAYPITFNTNDGIQSLFDVPISGWSNTPLKDL